MNIFENFRWAISNILASKTRTTLTTLGIIIGITSVIVITAVGKGYQIQSENMIVGIDKEAVNIYTNMNEVIRDKDKLLLEDVDSIRNLENVTYVMATYSLKATVNLKNPAETKSVTLIGANIDTKNINNLEILYGQFFNEQDIELKNRVCVIDNRIAREIFGREDVIGEVITAKSNDLEINLTVVGVFKDPNENILFSNTSIYSPITTLMDFKGKTDNFVDSISLKIDDTSNFEKVKKEILRLLSINHLNEESKYSIFGNFELLNFTSGLINVITIFIGIVASISLLVGGIGVMNIMLVTVTERTREIGIRKSLGATNSNIKMLFLIESMAVSCFGGLIGVILGYIGSFIVSKILQFIGNDIVAVVSIPVVIGAFVISSLIGIVFGVYPAGKAAKLDPIEALRYE